LGGADAGSGCTNPKLAEGGWDRVGAHFHPGGYSLSEREREIAVCIINSKWHSAYPTAAHERRGKEVGLPAEKVEALISGLATSVQRSPRSRWSTMMATALANSRWVPQGLYDRAVKALGHVGITDVITLMGLLHQRLDDPGLLRRCRPERKVCRVESIPSSRLLPRLCQCL